jgi:cytochrome P450
MLVQDDLMAPEVIRDPHTYYARLRETDPVHWNERWKGWIITRYDDVVRLLRDHERFSSDRMASFIAELSPADRDRYHVLIEILSSWFVFRDPPFHTRFRLLTNKAFTPMSVERLRPRVRQIIHGLLDRVAERGHMEFIRDYAFPLPVTVICEYLGVPAEDHERLKEWSDETTQIFFMRINDPNRRDRAQKGVQALTEYFYPLIHERKRHPRDDFITALVHAEERGDLLSEDEVATVCALLMLAGHETTTNALANGLLALLRNRDQWERLRADPSLARTAVEELLRYDGVVKAMLRWAKEDVEVGGKTIKEGDRILLSLFGANRDPAKFPEPDRLDVARHPNPHVAFGHGIHLCLGAPLARLELHESFIALSQRFPDMRLAVEPEELQYHPTVVSRALEALPVEW